MIPILPRLPLIAAAGVLTLSLSGCGGALMMGLSAAGGVMTLAKDGLDLDVSLHSLLNGSKPAAPIPPAALIANPTYAVVTPPPGVAGQPIPQAAPLPPMPAAQPALPPGYHRYDGSYGEPIQLQHW